MYVTLLTPENRPNFEHVMDEVFQIRHQNFNEWLGWGLPHVNGREFDKYDEQALHLVAMEDNGDVLGTWRMMPTTRPYMTAEVFPELLEEIGLVSDSGIWDLSRFALAKDKIGKNKAMQGRLIACLSSAVLEFGMMNGISEFLSVQNTYITPIANRMLGDPVWAGETMQMGVTDAACYSYAPSLERLYSLRTQFKLSSPVLSQFQITDLRKAA
ncbi:MAG: GNAT family N-acetyltransferase [Kordiimonadaceae bacterium]|nr:GNAT family N-acetyltransferase [Kordiimonadaceae bacterium]